MKDNSGEVSKALAEAHVDWFLKTLRPLLIDHMVHGFKHGIEYAGESVTYPEDAVDAKRRCSLCKGTGVMPQHIDVDEYYKD